MDLRDKFDLHLEVLNKCNRPMADAAIYVHDTMATAKVICENIYVQDWHTHLLDVYDRLNARHTLEQRSE
jgi:hypothetical protein